MVIKELSGLQKDFIARSLRSNLFTFRCLLDVVENESDAEYGFTVESLKRVELDVRKLRHYFLNS